MNIIEKKMGELAESGLRVVLPESSDVRILQAARALQDAKTCVPVLLGARVDIESAAARAGVDLKGIEIIDPDHGEQQDKTIAAYLAADPSTSEKRIRRKLSDPLNYGAILVRGGLCDCLAAGVEYATGDVILAAQQFIGVREGLSAISSIGYVDVALAGQRRFLGLSDCAVTIEPDAATLADIAIMSALSYHNITGEQPRVALLSYSSFGSADSALVEKVRQAVSLAHEKAPDVFISGEMQLDTALLPEVAARKANVDDGVSGQANVLVFPDLNCGNIAVKCIQLFGEAGAYGPLLQGFALPVTDFSRSADVDGVIGNIVLCLSQSGDNNG